MSTPARPAEPSWFQRHPEFFSDGLQIVKTVVATVLSWWVAVHVLGTQMPFLAPWTAMMAVHATVYRTVQRGLQTMVVTLLGVFLAFAVGFPLGVTLPSMILAMTVGVVASRIKPIREEGIAIAATALFILAGNDQYDFHLLGDRILEVFLGVGVGMAVTALVAPPLRTKQAEWYVEEVHRRMGHLLLDMARELDGPWDADRSHAWVERTEEMDDLLDTAWSRVRMAKESARWNPRARARHEKVPASDVLQRLHEGVSHLRHLVRTLEEATLAESQWDPDFRRRWTAVVQDTGRRLATPEAELIPDVDLELDDLTRSTPLTELPDSHWPLYGALLTSLRYIAHIANDVTQAEVDEEE